MAYTKGIAETIDEVRKAKTNKAKVAILQENNQQWMHQVLFMTYSPSWEWKLPEGKPPYQPLEASTDMEGQMFGELERFYMFRVPGPNGSNIGHPDLQQQRRETLFVQVLESIAPKDAELVIEMKSNKIKGVPKSVVEEAFPGLLDANL